MKTFRIPASIGAIALLVAACSPCGNTTPSSASGGSVTPPPAQNYSLSGSVSGLYAGQSFSLKDQSGNEPSMSVNANGAFDFPKALGAGATYSMVVAKQPTLETCSVTSGSGKVAAAGNAVVAIACVANGGPTPPPPATYTVGGTVSGLNASTSLTVLDNGGDSLTITSNGSFVFAQPLASGSAYSVSISSLPAGETCSMTGAAGVATSNASSVEITCASSVPTPPAAYTVGGTVSGLTAGKSLTVLDNGGDSLTVSANGAFAFATALTSGTAYTVSIATLPVGETCSITGATGVATSNATSVDITCSTTGPTLYSIGGTVSGLTGGGSLTILDNGGDAVTVTSNGAFTFPTSLATGSAYSASFSSYPLTENCFFFNGSGSGTVAGAAVTSITVNCALADTWTWQSGSSTANIAGSYGTLGVASANNVPGARKLPAQWTDSHGNFWIFGGYGVDSVGTTGELSDLWKFSPTANAWTWVSGSNLANTAGVYGTQGVAAAGNSPGGRYGSVTWIDAAGNLYLLDGYGLHVQGSTTEFNDLWKFDPTTTTWTWVGGYTSVPTNQLGPFFPGITGTQGSPDPANFPGGREGSASWTDANGNLYLFGGYSDEGSGLVNEHSDLWEFNPSTGAWTWFGGSIDQSGVYGTKGVASNSNAPGARDYAAAWKDAAGDFWLFGGKGYDSAGAQGALSDMWKFNVVAKTWTWVSGSNLVGAASVYGTKGVSSTNNAPGGQYGSASAQDAAGNVWLFGYGVLWEYTPTTNSWTWVLGTTSDIVTYGTQGVAALGNTPGYRSSSSGFMDLTGRLWVYGGYGYPPGHSFGAEQGDMFQFTPIP